MVNHDMIEQYWQNYLATLLADSPTRSEPNVAEQFGDNPALAGGLGAL